MGRARPYVVFFTVFEHGRDTLMPVYEIFQKDADGDATLIWANREKRKDRERRGLLGGDYRMNIVDVDRRPTVVVIFVGWWGKEYTVGAVAAKRKIPVVMVNHGAMFVYNSTQGYKKSIWPASVNCLWGQCDLDLWRGRWNKKDRFIVTGNPLHDQIIDYIPPEIEVPDEFALLLTPPSQRKFLMPSAEKLNKIIPVVAKIHHGGLEKDYCKQRYPTYDEPWMLLPLLYKAKLILANLSSSWIPALFWQKPIFVHSFDEETVRFSEFKDRHSHIFNFKQDDVWNSRIIDGAIRPDKKHFELFGHVPDGNNAARVVEVIRSYVK